MHHNVKLDENQIAKLRNAITLKDEALKGEHTIDIKEYHAGSFKEIRRARLSMPNIFGGEGTVDSPVHAEQAAIPEEDENADVNPNKQKVKFNVAESDESGDETEGVKKSPVSSEL